MRHHVEKRSFQRIPVQMPAEVEISLEHTGNWSHMESRVRGMVETIDISLGGFSAKILNSHDITEKSFSPARAYLLVGKEIEVLFKDFDITVWGKVVRVDPQTMLMAVIITRISDIINWRYLCSRAICAQSV